MKVLSTMLGLALLAQISMLPAVAQTATMSTTTAPAQMAQTCAPVAPACTAAPTCAPATIISQPAVVASTACERPSRAWLAIPAALLLATAIAVPIAVGVHEHNEHRSIARANRLQAQQLLLFDYQNQLIAAHTAALTPLTPLAPIVP